MQFVSDFYFSLAILLLLGLIVLVFFCGNPLRGRRGANWVVRQVASSVEPKVQTESVSRYQTRHQTLTARWPLWFGHSPSSAPPGWLIIEADDVEGWGVKLLIEGVNRCSHPQRAKSWVWRRWPRPAYSTPVEKRQDMAESLIGDIELCLDPRFQERFDSPDALFRHMRSYI